MMFVDIIYKLHLINLFIGAGLEMLEECLYNYWKDVIRCFW